MTLSLAAKKAVVQDVSAVAQKAVSAVIGDYRSLTANQMNELRKKARELNIYLRVVPNNLARRAFEGTEFTCLDDKLVGPLFIALSLEAPSDAARLMKDYIKTFVNLEVKALAVGGQVYEASQIDAVASLPTRDEAIAKLMYVMKAPVEKLTRTFADIPTKLVRAIAAIKDTKQ